MSQQKDYTSSLEKKVITKTVILPDGTYGTQTIVIDPTDHNQHKETKYLRNFVLETNFFFSTNLVLALTRIVIQMYNLDSNESKELFKTYFFNTINIICAILKMNSHKIYKDPDNVSRISMCLEFLMNGDFENFMSWVNESKELYSQFYTNNSQNKISSSSNQNNNVIIKPDEFISFRHVKPFDPENLDVIEDEIIDSSSYDENKKIVDELSSKQTKFTEVLTGSEVKLIFN
jgi:hypothetical protein